MIRESIRTKFSKKKKISEASLPPGYYTLGDGHVHKIPTTGYSKWYKRGDYKFRYNNATKEIEAYYIESMIDSMGLSFLNWVENPDYWVDYYLKEIEDTAEYENMYGESTELREDQSYVIAYREGGQDKYSSVQAQSSSDALKIFNAAIDKAGRNVSNAHIAVEDVELNEDLPPMRTYNVVRVVDGEPTILTTLEARNDAEAKANLIIALLDAGYYEDEVEPEIANGVITAQLKESAQEDFYLGDDDGYYVVAEYTPGDAETGIEGDRFDPLFPIDAISYEDALSKFISVARSKGYQDVDNLLVITPTKKDMEEWGFLECDQIKEATEDKKLYKVEYNYNYVEELEDAPFVRSAVFKGSKYIKAYSPEDAVNKVIDMSDEIANSTPNMEGTPYGLEVVGVWDSEEDFANQYKHANIDVIECDSKVNEALEDDPEVADQEYTSAATSINSSKLPAIFKMVKFNPGTINLDYGGGKFDNATQYLQDEYDVTNLVYDPYNRSSDHNSEVLSIVRNNGGADTITCSNVLNVIKEPEARMAVLRNCKNYLKNGGKAYFTVYEGSADGAEGPTKAGYQLNKKTADYVEEIEKVFSNVTRKGKLIIAEGISVNARVIDGNLREDYMDPEEVGVTLEDLKNAQYSASFMNDRAEVHIDGRTYVKTGEDKWEYIPAQPHALGYKVTTDRLWSMIQAAEAVDFYP